MEVSYVLLHKEFVEVRLLRLRKYRVYTGIRVALAVASLAFVSACSPAPSISSINDPYEANNRRVHEFNRRLDQSLLKPASEAYGDLLSEPISTGVDNFAANLSLPGIVLNNLLQGNVPDALSNSARFVINSTVGVAGLFDPASDNKLYEQSSDFGETLHVWGFREGNYVELPVLGPSTERDVVGRLVDFVMDPLRLVLPEDLKYLGTAAEVLDTFGDRDKYSYLVDSILYESEDSYAQSRLSYLQNRRRTLVGELTEYDLEDPYAE